MELISLQKLPAPLLAWYDANRRVLPWREEVSPYRTWVSIMTWQRYASPVWTDIRQTRTLQTLS